MGFGAIILRKRVINSRVVYQKIYNWVLNGDNYVLMEDHSGGFITRVGVEVIPSRGS